MNHLPEVEKLRACTERHYNCCQSILIPFSDVMGISKEEADRLGALFGGGMHHGGTCGTVTSALMILGMVGYEKDTAIALVRDFKEKHDSTVCKDLLAAAAKRGLVRKPHCDALVFEMTKYLDEFLGSRE